LLADHGTELDPNNVSTNTEFNKTCTRRYLGAGKTLLPDCWAASLSPAAMA
jgi:hypothetical protein